jgi:polysaccharide chain length determinant protein (PEP-CTERM system associated)
MDRIIRRLPALFRAIWHRRWLATKVACVACALGWLFVLLLPDKFEAIARVYVKQQTPIAQVVQGIAVDSDIDSGIDLVREALLSRPQLEGVARRTNLDRKVKTISDMDNLTRQLRKDIVVVSREPAATGNGDNLSRNNVYTISYQNSARERSIAVVRSLLDNFMEGTLSGNQSGSNEAQRFLVAQIKDYERRLQEAEARLADFKKSNVGAISGERGDYFTRLDREIADQQTAETNLAIAAGRRSELQRQLASAQPYVPGTSNLGAGSSAGFASDLSTRILEAEAKLEELRLQYTDKHPEVVALLATVRELKAREAKELQVLRRGGRGSGAIRSLATNPVYQQIQLQLNQSNVDIAALRGAIAEHRDEITKLRKTVDTAPEVEQQLSRLNRDYGVTKSQYEALVQRLEKAKISDDAAQSGIVKFDVIEPPRADIDPVWPYRPGLFAAVLIGSVLLGLLTAIARLFVMPNFDSVEMLRRVTGLEVLGAVSKIVTPAYIEQRQLEKRRLAWVGASLAIACLLLVLVGDFGAHAIQKLLS